MTQAAQLNHRLTSVDASFLYYERKETPLHIGGIYIFESNISFEEFVVHLSSKMPLLPRYRQKVVPAPFNVGHPTWEFDPNFNVRNHIIHREVAAPGTLDQFRELAAEIEMGMLDRSKPLWELYLVQGLEGGTRTGMVSKVHHAMVDGVSGVDLLKVMMDISPNPTPTPPMAEEPLPPPPDPSKRLIDSVLASAEEGVKGWMDFQSNLLNFTQTWLKEPQQSQQAMLPTVTNLLSRLSAPVSPLPFNREVSGQLKLGWAIYSFAEARGIRAVLGGTVNDVVLTALSGAVIGYLTYHNHKTAGQTLRVMVPVSMRKEDQRGALGNLVSVLPVEIPLDVPDPVERYKQLNISTTSLKGAKVAEGLNMFSALLGTVPPSLQAVFGSIAPTTVAAFNIVSTNVPGPQIPLYVLGRRMIAAYPFVPMGFAVGLSCSIFSYDQKLYFGISSDGKTMPDVDRLITFLDQSFAQLREAAGVPEQKTQVAPPPPADKPRNRTRTRKTAGPKVIETTV